MARWTVANSRDLYNVEAWGAGLFDVSDQGHAIVTTPRGTLDLKRIVDDCVRRGIRLPLLIRLPDVLEERVNALAGTFRDVIAEEEYGGRYRGGYPIKVNQERHIVEDIVANERRWGMGLECGSKPELLIALARVDDPDALIVINGYKDKELIEMAVAARQLGRNTIVVVEQPWELPMVLEAAKALDVRPAIGVRVKLGSSGSGRWAESSGDRAKFGLTLREIIDLVQTLEENDDLDMLQLLHFHMGSQVTAIRSLGDAVNEGARVFSALARMGVPLRYFDVGGGLAVDYDGSRTDFESSMNYDLREYVSVVVRTIRGVCDEHDLPHPDIVTESGRSLVAHSTLLVTQVLDSATLHRPVEIPGEDETELQSLRDLRRIYDDINSRAPQRAYHEAMAIRDETFARFVHGTTTLEERAAVEEAFYTICRRIVRVAKKPMHEELEHLPRDLADNYFCNFSVFQSAPDSWAVGQLFPIMPLSRLNEKPSRRGIVSDLTCDSDGKIDQFIDRRDVRHTLDLHDPGKDEPYYLGIFLLGAYQETLGDLHNLFGDTHAIHVTATADAAGYRIDNFIEGDTVEEVLGYLQYSRKSLLEPLRRSVERAYGDGTLTFEVGNRLTETFISLLRAYTYLG